MSQRTDSTASADHDHSLIVHEEQYRLDAEDCEFKDEIYLNLKASDQSARLVLERTVGSSASTFALCEKREIQISLGSGPAVLSGDKLRHFLGPDGVGPLISEILTGFSVSSYDDGRGNRRRHGELTEAAMEALEQLESQAEDAQNFGELCDDNVCVIDAHTYLTTLEDDDIEEIMQADTQEKLEALVAELKTHSGIFVSGWLKAGLAHVREDLLKEED